MLLFKVYLCGQSRSCIKYNAYNRTLYKSICNFLKLFPPLFAFFGEKRKRRTPSLISLTNGNHRICCIVVYIQKEIYLDCKHLLQFEINTGTKGYVSL